MRFDGIALGELAMAATGEVALTATASGSVQGQATGANPRALVESLIANLTLGLRDVELPGAPHGRQSRSEKDFVGVCIPDSAENPRVGERPFQSTVLPQ